MSQADKSRATLDTMTCCRFLSGAARGRPNANPTGNAVLWPWRRQIRIILFWSTSKRVSRKNSVSLVVIASMTLSRKADSRS